MKMGFRARSLLFGACFVATTVGGCKTADDQQEEGESAPEVVAANQLAGNDMAAGEYTLTFDDGPAGRTEELANWLGDRGIVATFFINGKNAPGREAALQAIKARGHVLANHTQNHVDMRQLQGDDLYAAVQQTDAVIAGVQPQGPWLLRSPYGAWDARVANDINQSDMKKYVGPIFWNIGGALTDETAADWACWSNGISVDDCANRYINEMNTRGRGVILMHDVHSKTVDMTKTIVERVGASHFVPITNAPGIKNAVLASLGGLPPSPPPSPGSSGGGGGCGTLDYKGRCDKNVLSWCKDGELKKADCAATSKVCSWKSDDEGHDCVAPSPCGDVNYFGACNGAMLTWCDESGALRSISCAAKDNRRCAVDPDAPNTGNTCIP